MQLLRTYVCDNSNDYDVKMCKQCKYAKIFYINCWNGMWCGYREQYS